MHDKEDRQNKFMAALQGVELEEKEEEQKADIADLKGWRANKDGFGIGMGLGHVVEG